MSEENLTIYHLHSDISNLTAGTGADSITKFHAYVDRAKELEMHSMAFSEHGSVLNWVKKKEAIEKAGMKYIHANEIYLTQNIDKEKGLIRDNHHYMLIAKNYDGVLELNKLTSNSFNRDDGHFYYNPRLTYEELKQTSDNIIMTSACLASPLWKLQKKAYNNFGVVDKGAERELELMLEWMGNNRHRMFFEIQYHNHHEQIEFNQMLYRLSKQLNIPLIAGTDTHALNKEHSKARTLYLKSKGADYGNEDDFDLTFKSHSEVVEMFEIQNAIPKDAYMEAIHNTNVMADMVESFELDRSPKYPKMYDNPIEIFKQKINEGAKKRGFDKFPKEKKKIYYDRIKEELETYIKLDAVDYMLLQKNIIDFSLSKGIYHGYGRGSVTGSLIAYALEITEMDSIKHNLNFFRFLNPERISLADIDIDFPPSRRQEVIDYLSTLEGIEFAEIITFNTKALRGIIRLVGKGLGLSLDEVDKIAKAVETFDGKDRIDAIWRTRYPELFMYTDIMNGVIESMGSHPSGFLVSPISIDEHISTLYTKESKYRVTALNMKEIDGQNYVKLDILGLANIELINETCKLAGIERLTPDNIDIKDIRVWKSLRESTLGVFQMESDSAYAYLKQLFSDETLNNIHNNVGEIDYIDLLSMANGAIRPAGKSYRQLLAQGTPRDNGHTALNESLKPTLGYLIFQEQIMNFLTDFCEHTGAESDSVRRGLAKKEGTEQYLSKIHDGFIKFMVEKHGETEEHAEEILQSYLKIIKDASGYGFSINHSSPYSYTGYIGAWLRYHYPLQFLTTVLNVMKDEKVSKIMAFAKKKNYEIKSISFGNSRAVYNYNEEEQNVYKGLASIKYMSALVAEQLYELAQNKEYDRNDWVGLLIDIIDNTSTDTRQMEILIRLDFFKEFGQKEALLEIYQCMVDKKKANLNLYPQFDTKTIIERKVKKYKRKPDVITETPKVVKISLKYETSHQDKTKTERLENLRAYELAVKAKPPRKIELYEQISYEKEQLGYAYSTWADVDDSYALVLEVNTKYTPLITLYQVSTGKETFVKIKKKLFYSEDEDNLLYTGDIIEILDCEEEDAWMMKDGKWERNPNKKDMFITKCKLVKGGKMRKETLIS